MAGPFDFLHIKGRTAGSSNELSFDVLDAARHDLDEKRKANRTRSPIGPKPSQGSYAGVAGTSTLSAVTEVERRKRKRRARTIRIRVAMALVIVAVVSVGGFAGYRFYRDTVDFAGHFNALINRLVEIDHTLVEVDGLMADPLNSVELEARDDAVAASADIQAKLDAVIDEARQMSQESVTSSDETALLQLEEAAQARKSLLALAVEAFTLSDTANQQANMATQAWNKVLAGDAVAREASELANSATTEQATEQAREKTEEAIVQMKEAQSQLKALQESAKGLDFKAEVAYIDKRLESLDAAVQTAQALLANNRDVATAMNRAYNEADGEAASLAAALPASIGNSVKSTYAEEMFGKKDAYASARSAVASADSSLRSYRSLPS